MADGARRIIERLGLSEHPEGGYYREIYRSPLKVSARGLERRALTCIYYLLPRGSFSAFHRLRSDEIWHFLEGSVLRLHCLDRGGLQTVDLGAGKDLQQAIAAGTWFAAEVVGGEYSLAGCTVAPGFEFEDFELARRETLAAEFSRHADLIARLTR